MEHFLGFAFTGVPYGCTYALVAVCLVLTYQATGVFNFAFGAQAFASAFIFTYLTEYHGWSGFEAFLVSVVVMGPLVGCAFDRLLFRHIANSNSTAKMVCSLALLVGHPQPAARHLRAAEPGRHGHDLPVLQPERRLLHHRGDADQRHLPRHHLGHRGHADPVDHPVALHGLGLQMRAAVESRRLVQLDGVDGNGVVAVAWIVSSFMASLAGVLFAPNFGAFSSDDYVTLTVVAIAAAAWALLALPPDRRGRRRVHRRAHHRVAGLHLDVELLLRRASCRPSRSSSSWGPCSSCPRCASLDANRDPLATIDPPPPPIAAMSRAPSMNRIIRILWWVLFAGFCVSMLTWIPAAWTTVFNNGLTYSIVLLSITLITGMAGQLSLCQATLAGVGAFTAAQLANHLGLNLLARRPGRSRAGRRRRRHPRAALPPPEGLGSGAHDAGRGAALRCHVLQRDLHHRGSRGHQHPGQVARHQRVLQLQRPRHVPAVARGPGHRRLLGAARPQGNRRAQPGRDARKRDRDGGIGREPLVAADHGVRAVRGHRRRRGLLHSLEQQVVSPTDWNADISLVLVVLVVTTSVTTVEGAIQAGIGFFVTEQILTTVLPARIGASSLTVVLFAFGVLTYASHPEGVLEFQKRKSTMRFERLFFCREAEAEELKARAISTSGANG